MGNSSRKLSDRPNRRKNKSIQREKRNYFSQFSLSSFANNSNNTNVANSQSVRSTQSASPPSARKAETAKDQDDKVDFRTLVLLNSTPDPFKPEFTYDHDAEARDFIILGTISKGAFGIVYKVKRNSDNKIYALKKLKKSQIISNGAVKQVKDEVHIQKVCGHHQFIVTSIHHWQSVENLFILSEYVEGGELQRLFDRLGLFPEELVRIFVAEIAITLDFLHNAGVVYRDLKPENILLSEKGHIQLIDFGLSKWLRFGAYTSTICGTLNYMGTI